MRKYVHPSSGYSKNSHFFTLFGLPSRWKQWTSQEPRLLECSWPLPWGPQISCALTFRNRLKDNYSTQTKKQLSVHAILKGILHCHIGITEWRAIKMHRGGSVLIRISYIESSLLRCFPARGEKTPRCLTTTSVQKTQIRKDEKVYSTYVLPYLIEAGKLRLGRLQNLMHINCARALCYKNRITGHVPHTWRDVIIFSRHLTKPFIICSWYMII